MSLEKNKAIIRKAIEALNKRDLAALDQFIAPDYVDHTNQIQGIGSLKQFYSRAFEDFPDFQRTIEDIAAQGDKVWARSTITGTALTGKKMELTSMNIFRIVNGKIAETWGGVIQKMVIPRAAGELAKQLL